MKRMLSLYLYALLTAPAWLVAAENDWPCYRGPNHDGISLEKNALGTWPKEGPKVLWKAKVGIGFSSFAVSQGRVFTLGNKNDEDTLYAFDSDTGKELWKYSYACALDPKYYEGGPGATPCVDGNLVYSLSKEGQVTALQAADGKKVWERQLADEGFGKPDWGFNGSPLVEGHLLIINAGAGGIAYDKTTGKIVWKSAIDKTGYSTPLPLGAGDERVVVLGAGKSYKSVRVKDGKELWSFAWDTEYEVNASDPLIVNDQALFISSGYEKGCALIQPLNAQPKAAWQNKNLRVHMYPGLFLNGGIFGLDGNTSGGRNELKCLNPATGAVAWAKSGFGTGALIGVGGKIIALTEKGELVVFEPDPAKYTEVARAQILGGKSWTAPAVSNGKLYARNAAGDVVCVSIKGE